MAMSKSTVTNYNAIPDDQVSALALRHGLNVLRTLCLRPYVRHIHADQVKPKRISLGKKHLLCEDSGPTGGIAPSIKRSKSSQLDALLVERAC